MRMTKIIKRVERVDCSLIGDELKNGLNLPSVIRSLPWKEIEIKRHAEVSVVQKNVEKEVVFEVNAKFYTCQDMEKASDAQWNEVKIQWKTKFPIPEI